MINCKEIQFISNRNLQNVFSRSLSSSAKPQCLQGKPGDFITSKYLFYAVTEVSFKATIGVMENLSEW